MPLKITLLGSVATSAVFLSAGVAAIGVAGIVGVESLLTQAGTAALVLGTVLTEAAAAKLPAVISDHCAAGTRAGWIKGAVVTAGFGVFTAWNLAAGHMGMVAINNAGVSEARAPLEAAAADTDAARITAEENLKAHDDAIANRAALLADGLRGAYAQGYVSSSTRNFTAGATASPQEAAKRESLAKAVADARGADLRAEAELARAPEGRPDHELWLFAAILELLKGALLWFAAPLKRDRTAGVIRIDPAAIESMSDEELAAAWESLSEARSTSTTIWHALRRRKAA